MALFSKKVGLLGTENAFKIGPKIRALEEQGKEGNQVQPRRA